MVRQMVLYMLLMFLQPCLLIAPDLRVTKKSSVIGELGTTYQVNITIQHSRNSTNDSFDIEIIDEVYDMKILSINVVPKLNSRSHYSTTFTPWKVVGLVPHLELNQTVSMIYSAQFLRNEDAVKSITRTMVTWSNGSGNPKLGPKYTDTSCVMKHVQNKNTFIGNYGYIVLGIVLGIASGCIIATLIIICLKRCPSTKKYILHTDEAVEQIRPIMTEKAVVVPAYYDETADEKEQKKTKNDINVLRKVTGKFKNNEVGDIYETKVPNEIMWRSALFNEDVISASNALDDCYNNEYTTLLEFTLKLWTCIWKSVLRMHVDKLFSARQINIETKNKYCETLGGLIQNNIESRKVKSIKEFIDTTSDIVLKSVNTGGSFYDDLLENIRVDDNSHRINKTGGGNASKKEEKERVIKKQKEMEELKMSYVSSLNEDFTYTSARFFETLRYISSMFIHARLRTISTALLLLLIERSVSHIHRCFKHTVVKHTDSLKRRRLLSNDMDSAFSDIFSDELEILVKHLILRKKKIVEAHESNLLSAYLKQISIVDGNYREILNALSELSNYTSENVTQTANNNKQQQQQQQQTFTVENLVEKFVIAVQYVDSYEKIAQNEIISVDSHSGFLEELTHSLNVFISRMKTHVDDIYNNKVGAPELVNDLGSYVGDPVFFYSILLH